MKYIILLLFLSTIITGENDSINIDIKKPVAEKYKIFWHINECMKINQKLEISITHHLNKTECQQMEETNQYYEIIDVGVKKSYISNGKHKIFGIGNMDE